jgi:hypothetical protein
MYYTPFTLSFAEAPLLQLIGFIIMYLTPRELVKPSAMKRWEQVVGQSTLFLGHDHFVILGKQRFTPMGSFQLVI